MYNGERKSARGGGSRARGPTSAKMPNQFSLSQVRGAQAFHARPRVFSLTPTKRETKSRSNYDQMSENESFTPLFSPNAPLPLVNSPNGSLAAAAA